MCVCGLIRKTKKTTKPWYWNWGKTKGCQGWFPTFRHLITIDPSEVYSWNICNSNCLPTVCVRVCVSAKAFPKEPFPLRTSKSLNCWKCCAVLHRTCLDILLLWQVLIDPPPKGFWLNKKEARKKEKTCYCWRHKLLLIKMWLFWSSAITKNKWC